MNKKKHSTMLCILCLLLICNLTACESFYQLFVDEEHTSAGVYFVIYNADSSEEEIASIPELPFMKGDLTDLITTYDLSFEITLAFDLETDADATLTAYYYHNQDDPDADDYCEIGFACIGTYTMEDDIIRFTFEPEGYNIAIYEAGSDYTDLEAFQAFSYAGDYSTGIWAYANTTYEYEDTAVILEDVVQNLPAVMNFTVDGSTIVTWDAED